MWLLVDVDLSRVWPKAVRLNISLPEPLVAASTPMPEHTALSRSGFLARAADRAMRGDEP